MSLAFFAATAIRAAQLQPDSVDARVAASSDDANQDGTTVTLTDTVLGLGVTAANGELTAGVRWDGVALTQGTTVTEAFVEFTASATNTAACVLRIQAVDADDAGTFTTGASDISSRTLTTAFVDWDVPAWSAGQDISLSTSPDISSVINEVIGRAGWVSGNAIALVITLSPENTVATFPRRRAVAYDGSTGSAPRLLVNTTAEAAPVYGALELRGDAAFSVSSLDDAVADQFGVTHRDWYDRMIASIGTGSLDSDFTGDDNRDWCRTGNMAVTSLLLAFRYSGDLRLLDEAVRLMEIAWGDMTDTGTRRYWVSNDVPLDVSLASGLVACIAWACRNNDDLTSPAGYNYGTLATKYYTWLVDDFLPHWEVERSAVGSLPVLKAYWGHSWANEMRLYHYVGKLGGGNGKTAAEYAAAVTAGITLKLASDGTDTVGGKPIRVSQHYINGTSDAGKALQYTTYVRYEIPAWLDLALDGADDRLDDTFFTEWANSLADFVLDGDPESTGLSAARSIGGDLKPNATSCTSYDPDTSPVYRAGIIYNHCFSYRLTDERLGTGAFVLLAGYDTSNHAEPYLHDRYPALGSSAVPTNPTFAAGRVFNLYRHNA